MNYQLFVDIAIRLTASYVCALLRVLLYSVCRLKQAFFIVCNEKSALTEWFHFLVSPKWSANTNIQINFMSANITTKMNNWYHIGIFTEYQYKLCKSTKFVFPQMLFNVYKMLDKTQVFCLRYFDWNIILFNILLINNFHCYTWSILKWYEKAGTSS